MHTEQVSVNVIAPDLIYVLGCAAVMLAVVGVTFLDIGLARNKNVIDTVTQKISAGVICAVGFIPIGYAVWMWQFYEALGVPEPLKEAIGDWWVGGDLLGALPQDVDPAVFPGVDSFQIFFVFFIAFAFFMGAVIHTAGVERMKPGPVFALSFVSGAVLLPILTYLMWGSTGPLSSEGVHDHIGGLVVYVPLGIMGLLIAWRVGPRIGRFGGATPGDEPGPQSIPMIAVGVLLVLVALPFFALGGGYTIPDYGFFGISMTTSGFAHVVINLFMAMFAAGICGVLLSYRLKSSYFAIAGPFIGYVAGASFMDVAAPLTMALVCFFAPIVSLLALRLMEKLSIDEEKLVPLVLAPGLFGVIVGGFTEWHTAMGGYFDITEGKFAFQGAEVTPWMQLLGLAVSGAITIVLTMAVLFVYEKLWGLRVEDEEERAGLDAKYWTADLEPH